MDNNQPTQLEEEIRNVPENPYAQEEEKFGYRLSWNVWNTNKLESQLIPIGCMYSPLTPCGIVEYEPLACIKCHSVLCPLSTIDVNSMSWHCTLCGARNQLPNELGTDQNFLATGHLPETNPENSTIEYVNSRSVPFAPTFVFIIDRCTYDADRHTVMINGLRHTLDLLPEDSIIVVITFGTNIELHSFDNQKIKTIYQFSGEMAYERKNLSGINDMKNILVKKEDCIENISELVNSLEKDPFPVAHGFRPNRCTGAAVSFATSLLEPFKDCPVKYLLFTQGPCTFGPGQVSLVEIGGEGKLSLDKAESFYKEEAEKISSLGHSLDLIAETIADIGLEYKAALTTLTGGTVILAQDFDENIKTNTLRNIYKKNELGNLDIGFNARIQVKTSSNVKFKDFIGEGSLVNNGWKIGSILPDSNISLIFEPNELSTNNSYGHVQIITTYQRSDKSVITRVTTFSRLFSSERNYILQGLQCEAAAVLVSRLFILKKFEKILDTETSIDRHLIKFTRRYAKYYRNNPSSLSFPLNLEEYLKYMFFFRRSSLVQKEGISEDEYKYFKILLYKLPVSEASKLIKPHLYSFHYQGEISEVPLDVSSLNAESILVLDAFHNVLLWRGQDINDWIRQGIDKNPEYSFFKKSKEDAENFVNSLIESRIPTPQFRETAAGKSQERILLNFINPGSFGEINSQKIDYDKFFNTLSKHVTNIE